MTNRRSLVALVLALGLVVVQVSAASAAPLSGGSGTSCAIATVMQDSSANWDVTCTNSDSATLTQQQAIDAGLLDSTGTTQLLFAGDSITLPTDLVTNPCALLGTASGGSTGTSTDGNSNPVAEALGTFFCSGSTNGTSMIEQLHMEGFGFGEIGQAFFMAQALGGGVTAAQLLMDKQNHDFTGITLADGSTPKNWGMLMKWLLGQEVKSKTNLGAIMSGRATAIPTETGTIAAPSSMDIKTRGKSRSDHGGGKGEGHGRGNGSGNRP